MLLGNTNAFSPVSTRVFFLDTALNVFDTLIISDPASHVLTTDQFLIEKNGDLLLLATFIDTLSNESTSKILHFDDQQQLLREKTYDTTGMLTNVPGSGGLIRHPVLNKIIMHQGGERDSSSLFLLDDSLNFVDSSNMRTSIFNQLLGENLILSFNNFSTPLPNGNFVISASVDNPNPNNSFAGPAKGMDAGIMIFDSAFNKLHTEIIGAVDTGVTPGLFPFVVDSTHFYHISTKFWSNFNWYGTDSTFSRLIKFDLNGNIISERLYSHLEKTRLNSILKTQEGDFLLSGYTYDSLNFNAQGLNAYVMKIDSMGNLITGIEENKLSLSPNDFLIYPNPVNDLLRLRKVNFFEPYQFRLFTVNGQEVLRLNWIDEQTEIALVGLPKGVYLYRIESEKRGAFSGKIIKQ